MVIGNNDDIDFIDELDDEQQSDGQKQDPTSDNHQEPEKQKPEDRDDTGTSDSGEGEGEEDDFLTSLLKSRGIEDKSKIKFATEEGDIEEVDWDSLSSEDKLNILSSSESTPENGLDESEIQLINAIRNSGMNPAEYLQFIGNGEVERYIQNSQEPQYEIDAYSDDELFLMDFMSRMGEVTEDEATEALERAKANEGLFKKQIEAIRNEYKQAEQENQMQAQLEQEQIAQQQYDQFSDQIVDEINDLKEIQGFELNMENDDMQELYDFITGQDAAGNNYLAKALSDPRILVKTAWLALNGDQMINDITSYFQKEIANVRKESYKKGVTDTQKKMEKTNNVVFKDTHTKPSKEVFDDLDEL